ncbi:hypothetical protein M9H77_34338 [Catharanthus roseus]|uniref:Uncharacterized protein n=1 Tax=Catharanthus roseus TaxID=4058 RepID=A0ACB9ZL63_CATRO|nr:hypothetical protein M9H77_34338 [Catharanthus roseus]
MASIMRESFFVVLLFACFSQCTQAQFNQYDAYIVNGLPDNSQNFRAHIFSGDDDLGYHDLKVNEKFRWHFRMSYFGNTKFYAHFWWGNNKERSFAVFDKHLAPICGEVGNATINICWWLVKKDGFYLANKIDPAPGDLKKMNWWLNKTTIM